MCIILEGPGFREKFGRRSKMRSRTDVVGRKIWEKMNYRGKNHGKSSMERERERNEYKKGVHFFIKEN